jgi:hypothetical protein
MQIPMLLDVIPERVERKRASECERVCEFVCVWCACVCVCVCVCVHECTFKRFHVVCWKGLGA